MKRLVKENINTPQEYDKIFEFRKKKGVDWADMRRWKTLLKYYKGGRLADLGCLDSLVPSLAHEKYPQADLWGIDQAEEAITEMRRTYPYVKYVVGNVYELPFKDFDYVVAGEILEHLEHPERFIKETMRIVKSWGVLAISTPLDEAREVGAVDGERHLWSFTEKDIKQFLSPYGEVKTQTLRSRRFPTYKYCWPQLIAWVKKK